MSVDKVKDTSPKKPIAENKIVEAKPKSPPRLKANRTLHRKSKVWARVRRRYPKPTRTTGTTFLGRRKAIAPVVYRIGDLCSRRWPKSTV